jgi:mono/diheme cytochrome c family protein
MKPILVAALSIFWSAVAHAAPSQGEYLARAADCVACHTAEGGAPYAGGRAFVLPMGTIYSPNITPDHDTGVGDYTDDEWVAAIQHGIGRGGRHLYPAMPYTSYSRMTREDALAIKAYIFTLPPIHKDNESNQLGFPFNQRWGLRFWDMVNASGRAFEPDTARSPEWNRGAYLVQALGHCGECHTPRNWMMGLKTGQDLAGAVQAGWMSYNITSDREHGIGAWSDADLAQYLSTGTAPHHGPASGPMADAISNSLRFLTPQDIHAIVAYLRTVPAQQRGPEIVTAARQTDTDNTLGAHIFETACAGCHLPNGEGRQSPWAALAGSHSAGDPAGTNTLQILMHGSELQTPTGLVFMHSFAGSYTDEELAAVSRYVTSQFSGRKDELTAAEFGRARVQVTAAK